MDVILEIIKIIAPSLIVFATAYYVLKQYLQAQYQKDALRYRSNISKDAIPLKLKAYERLLLFCSRIDIANLILRLKTRDMTVEQLTNAMVVSVQKEYEHNLAQQLYTSNKLWEIITLSKNDIIALVFDTAKTLPNKANANELSQELMKSINSNANPLKVAEKAIKEEAKLILDV